MIAARLVDPRTDPHGDSIPTPDGQVAETPGQDLGSLRPGQRGRVTRVPTRYSAVLRFLTAEGISALGDVLEVTEIRSAGAVTVQAPSGTRLLSSPSPPPSG